MRINKYLALCRAGSRRGVEIIIISNRVRVNGVIVSNLATDIVDTDIVTVDGKPVKMQTDKVYIMLNKPTGIITTVKDSFGRKTVIDLIYENPKQYKELLSGVRLFPVGRLDYNTSGLIILTNDGELTKELTHPSSETEKVYIAVTERPITESELKTLSAGVLIDTSPQVFGQRQNETKSDRIKTVRVKTAPVKTDRVRTVRVKTAPAEFKYFDKRPDGRNKIQITIHEGKNRQIRKMFESIGVNVKTLQRIAEGKLNIGNLKTGEWRFIKKSEII
jgi:23S rRNA pseudouridine2605 synthase